MEAAERLRFRTAFDGDAAAYDGGRPPHPAWVFERLASQCGWGEGTRVLEVGPGTGQVTVPLAERGALVTAVELGANLAERLRANTSELPVEVVVGDFETIPLPRPGQFDLAVSANAFHWLDPVPALRRLAEALRPEGWLALWWNVFRDPGRPDPFSEAIQPVYRELIATGDRSAGAMPYALRHDAVRADIAAAKRFGPVSVDDRRSELSFTAEQVRAMFATYSEWRAQPEVRRSEALDRIESIARDQFGGAVSRPRRTVLYLAQREERQ